MFANLVKATRNHQTAAFIQLFEVILFSANLKFALTLSKK